MNSSLLSLHVARASVPPSRDRRAAPREHAYPLPVVRELPADTAAALGPALAW